jgi:hypothetical protein
MGIDAAALREIFSVQSAAWATTAILFLLSVRMWNGAPAMLDRWLAFRAARAAEKSADWNRRTEELRRIDERCQRLEQAEERCRSELGEVLQRLAALEGYQAGYGRASQEAAGVVAIERLKDHDKP